MKTGRLGLATPNGPLHFTLVLAQFLLELSLHPSVVLAHLRIDAPLRFAHFAFRALLSHTHFLCE
jgi:hypothetical protein